MLRRGSLRVALVAAAVAFAVLGLWLLAMLLVVFAVILAGPRVLDDELRAQRMAVVAATVSPKRKLDRAGLEQLVDDDLCVVAFNQGAMATLLQRPAPVRQIDGTAP